MEESRIELACIKNGLKMTEQRRVIARVLSDAVDHPDVEEVHRRSNAIDTRISVATVYRTVRLFADEEIVSAMILVMAVAAMKRPLKTTTTI